MFAKSPSEEWARVGFSEAIVSNSFHVAYPTFGDGCKVTFPVTWSKGCLLVHTYPLFTVCFHIGYMHERRIQL